MRGDQGLWMPLEVLQGMVEQVFQSVLKDRGMFPDTIDLLAHTARGEIIQLVQQLQAEPDPETAEDP